MLDKYINKYREMSCFRLSPSMSEMPVSLFFILILLGGGGFAVAHHEGDEPIKEFISMDCGSAPNSSYTDKQTGKEYTSDVKWIDAGESHTIAGNLQQHSLPRWLWTLRSFRGGGTSSSPRSCYSLPASESKDYLVRATFMHGDYDGPLAAPLQFDLHIDISLCKTVNVTDASVAYVVEVLAVASTDSIAVCLIDKGSGTPFISALEFGPLADNLYYSPLKNQNLLLFVRLDLGSAIDEAIRFPKDPFDRVWEPLGVWSSRLNFRPSLHPIDTNQNVDNTTDVSAVPSVVMQTAVEPAANSSVLEFSWDYADSGAPVNSFYAFLHFAELRSDTNRVFDIYLNGDVLSRNYTPSYLIAESPKNTTVLLPLSSRYQWALNSTGLSPLSPILNALEIYTTMNVNHSLVDHGDADAILIIKKEYKVKRNWMGDACSPVQYAWRGLNCSYLPNSITTRITSINLSSSELTGFISPSFASLSAIESIDLSNNNLTGSIPENLGDLQSLKFLNLSGNNLTGDIPDSLLRKRNQGALTAGFEGNPFLCSGASCAVNGKSKKLAAYIIVILCVIPVLLLFVVIFMVWRLKKSQGNLSTFVKRHGENPLQHESRQFTYKELQEITKNFKVEIGKGGFGSVYHGCLEDGTQVAVKLRSQTSSQGTKEFIAEAQNLMRIHHKNLVTFIGYCMDVDHLALVCEFMSQGSLHDHLRGDKASSTTALTWAQRLQIAVDAAHGLEYLHKGCKPPLIHRDVKTANILLSESLEAKIADFGLSKAFLSDVDSHVSTSVVGTPGYLDPEYHYTYQLSEKSDVYSFGVVLLELITGQPPVLKAPRSTSLIQWAHHCLATGNIENVVDANLQDQYDMNSMWKAADVALRCTSRRSHQRPTMTEVVLELKESLALQTAGKMSDLPSVGRNNLNSETAGISQTTADTEFFAGIYPDAR